MAKSKIAITLDEKVLANVDSLVRAGRYPNRSRAFEAAAEAELVRVKRTRLAQACLKVDAAEERTLAEEGLAAEFGLPVEEQRKLAILPAENSKKGIFTTDDYPEAAIRKAIGAPTYGVVSIDASGKPTGCYIVEPSGSPEIDAKSCSVYLQRGHFKPARDLGGNAVRGLYPFHINWVVGW